MAVLVRVIPMIRMVPVLVNVPFSSPENGNHPSWTLVLVLPTVIVVPMIAMLGLVILRTSSLGGVW